MTKHTWVPFGLALFWAFFFKTSGSDPKAKLIRHRFFDDLWKLLPESAELHEEGLSILYGSHRSLGVKAYFKEKHRSFFRIFLANQDKIIKKVLPLKF